MTALWSIHRDIDKVSEKSSQWFYNMTRLVKRKSDIQKYKFLYTLPMLLKLSVLQFTKIRDRVKLLSKSVHLPIHLASYILTYSSINLSILSILYLGLPALPD